MSESTHVEVRRGAYHDSVTLMQVSRDVTDADGVVAAQVAMGTELNLDVLRGMGFEPPLDAGPNDLVVAVRTADAAALPEALARVDAALASAGRGGGGGLGGAEPEPRTVASAVRRAETPPTLALVSVPGPHAFTEAMSALRAGLSVLVFSDNVPVEAEVRLKDEAAERDLLVMGPDCGTAVVAGAGLGFANAVRPGPVGLVAASGTGAQQLMCLLDGAGVGVSHCLGVGGRDLSAAVAGRSTKAALTLLDEDPATELVVVVSKPPDATVAADVTAYAEKLSTPVHLALLGQGQPDLTAVAQRAVEAVGATWSAPRRWDPPAPRTGTYPTLRGLFAGGTLCDEAMVVAAAALGPIRSNIPLQPDWALGPDLQADGHLMIDFGDDELTQGRPHPMIDQRTRIDRLGAEAGSPGVLLMDVVLGHGAHPDPAAELAPAIESALAAARDAGHDLAVVVSLCAAADDPQGLERQAEALAAAGASVHLSNADAARTAVGLVGGSR
ncbi:MAG TPA: FdrA family protein [Actinomycetes bacterium]|nr:FdrA family protein [Actinomycetes bacterium]